METENVKDNSRSAPDESVDTIVISVYGREYPLRCATENERLEEVVEYVEAKMKQVGEASSLSSYSEIAVLAALNITDELLDARNSDGDSQDDLRLRAKTLLMPLDEKLPNLESSTAGK